MDYTKSAKQSFDFLRTKKDVYILSVESSCDETSIAIVKNGREVLSNIVASQIEIHRRFGGVVPEVASRNHITAIYNIFEEALAAANMTKEQIDAVAVTYGAGLVGALLVGVNFAKALAYRLGVPLIAVSHIYGHIAANYISHKDLQPPFVCLMVSGGHTALLRVDDYNAFSLLGHSVDDAAGEAFDKVARVLGLNYPGGPEIEKLAKAGSKKYDLTVSKSLSETLNFSFSGIKTAVVNIVHNAEQRKQQLDKADLAYSFQDSVTDDLCHKAVLAIKRCGLDKLVVAGGVGANGMLKEKLAAAALQNNFQLFVPDLKYCTDNGAMIGSAAYFLLRDGLGRAGLDLTASANVAIAGDNMR